MKQNIRTRWHRMVQLVKDDEVYFTAPEGGNAEHWGQYNPNRAAMNWFLDQLTALPRFVVDTDLLELVMREGYEQALMDMKKVGVLRMPFPAMIVEFDHAGRRYAVLVRDQQAGGRLPWEPHEGKVIDRGVSQMNNGDPTPFYGITFRLETDIEGEYLVMSPSVAGVDIEDRGRDHGGIWLGICAVLLDVIPETLQFSQLVQSVYLKDGSAIYRAIATAMLVMHTGGVKREVVDCSHMNRKRIASNKPPIPKHIVLSIGKVYRSAADNAKADDYIPRKSPMPHWRKGHLRTVRWGQHHANVKQVYINPKLVAFHEFPGAVAPIPKQYVVTK